MIVVYIELNGYISTLRDTYPVETRELLLYYLYVEPNHKFADRTNDTFQITVRVRQTIHCNPTLQTIATVRWVCRNEFVLFAYR